LSSSLHSAPFDKFSDEDENSSLDDLEYAVSSDRMGKLSTLIPRSSSCPDFDLSISKHHYQILERHRDFNKDKHSSHDLQQLQQHRDYNKDKHSNHDLQQLQQYRDSNKEKHSSHDLQQLKQHHDYNKDDEHHDNGNDAEDDYESDKKALLQSFNKEENNMPKFIPPLTTGVTEISTMQQQESLSPMSGYALVGAMSFHSVFDGLAIGTTNSSSSQLTAVTIAVFAHKPIASFALGSMLMKGTNTTQPQLQKKLVTQLICFFAITSPVGILLGVGTLVALEHETRMNVDTNLVSAICQSFAAGTFLYVATVEVMSKEFFVECTPYENDIDDGMGKRKKRLKFGVCCLGVALMALIKLLEADDDDDD